MAGDCDDDNAAVNPDAVEVCNGIDDDCDRMADPEDEVGRVDCYADGDGDGYGDPASWSSWCACPDGTVADASDCDDDDALVYPGALETWYDGVDQDCGGDSDFDADGDGFEHDVEDCDDGAPAVHPDADEICGNGIDDDCDGQPGDCGWDGEVSSHDATLTITDDEGYTAWTVGSATDDIDGDGRPELLVARHGDLAGDPARLEYRLLSLAAVGSRTLDDATVARFTVDADPDRWETNGAQDSYGGMDLDGDGYADYLLGAANGNHDGIAADPSRVYLEFGPVVGVGSLEGALMAVASSSDESVGGRGLAVIDAGGDGEFSVAAGVHAWDPSPEGLVVRFLTEAHFREASP